MSNNAKIDLVCFDIGFEHIILFLNLIQTVHSFNGFHFLVYFFIITSQVFQVKTRQKYNILVLSYWKICFNKP